MNEKLSAFLDGELSDEELDCMLDEMAGSPRLRSDFSRLHMIRLAVRGQCSAVQLATTFRGETEPHPAVLPSPMHSAKPKPRERFSIAHLFDFSWWRQYGGAATATGMAAALVIGFFANDLLDSPAELQTGAVTAAAVPATLSWQSPSLEANVKVAEHLNQSLLNLSEVTNISRIASKADALLVSYSE